jgi:carbohydrate diacid regulator
MTTVSMMVPRARARSRIRSFERWAAGAPMEPAQIAHALEELRVAFAELRSYEEELRALHATLPGMHHALKERLIRSLLHGQIRDDEAILTEARILGLDFGPPRTVILIDAADYILSPDDPTGEAAEAAVRRRVQMVISSVVSFFHLPDDTICAHVGDGEIAVLKASNTKNLAVWARDGKAAEQANPSWANLAALKRASNALLEHLGRTTGAAVSIGIGRYHPGIHQLSRSYQDARAALSLGRRFHGKSGVHCLDKLGIAAFVGVADEQTKIDLATYLLSPLNGEPELLTTLDAYFASNCSPIATARRLNIHRNTLTYRLDKITALTGLDPRCFDDSVQIRLALVLRTLRDHPA